MLFQSNQILSTEPTRQFTRAVSPGNLTPLLFFMGSGYANSTYTYMHAKHVDNKSE